MLNKMK